MTNPTLRGEPPRWRVIADRRARAMQLAYFALFDGPRGRGRPVPAQHWDAQWREGEWDYLVAPEELPRYAVIAGLIRSVSDTPAVLDAGCGDGHVLTMLGRAAVSEYHGLDISGEAVARARARHADATFDVADLATWTTTRRFHVVVMNEVLYYLRDPAAAVARYAEFLHDDGLLIMSMFRHGNTRLIWRDLGRRFSLVDAAAVTNRLGEVVDIKTLSVRS